MMTMMKRNRERPLVESSKLWDRRSREREIIKSPREEERREERTVVADTGTHRSDRYDGCYIIGCYYMIGCNNGAVRRRHLGLLTSAADLLAVSLRSP